MEVTGKKVLVFGSGISGIGAVKLLEDHGAEVILYDGNDKLDKVAMKEQLGDGVKAEIILGEFPEKLIDTLDIAVLSPGVPTDLPVVNAMRDKKVAVIGEVELAYAFGKGDVLAITGTNGKTTTTTLLGEIMKAYKEHTYVVGNIGNPYTVAARQMEEDAVAVAEMSSFQLESIVTFRPKVSAILNFTPDHLNRHHTMEAYVNAKKNIAKNQTAEDYCILNYEDERTREFGEHIDAQVIYFSSRQKLEKGIYLDNGNMIYKNPEEVLVCNVDELQLLGMHNYENYMAAVAMAAVYGVPMDIIRKVIRAFKGVEHRIEYVDTVNGVAYYNDSKGTNPDAAIKGIKAMNRPTWLIGGGYDKKSTYDEWIEAFDGKVKELILMGVTAPKIAECAKAHGFDKIKFVDSMEDAVSYIAEKAQDGDAVLLSPACASWGMFPNYEVRGDIFKDCVRKLKEN